MLRVIGLVLAGLSFVAGTARGQEQRPRDLTELSLEDLLKVEVETVFGASKFRQKVTEAPASITIITADDIQKYGYRTLADVLRSVRGFYVSYDRNYSYAGVRGFGRPGDYNIRILFLVDGHRMNDAIYDGAYIGTDFSIDVDLIERVEIIRGPSSSLYGTSAFFAVVNIITKRGRDLAGITVSTEVASLGTYKGRFSFGAKSVKGVEMLFSGTFLDSRGNRRLYYPEFDDPATNNGVSENADDDQHGSIFADLGFGSFRLQGALSRREKGIPTGAYGTLLNSSASRTVDNRGYANLRYTKTFSNGWELMSRAAYDRYDYEGDYAYDAGASQVSVSKDYGRGEWWTFESSGTRTFFSRHKVAAGVEVRHNSRLDQGSYNVEPFEEYLRDQRTSTNWGIFFQDEYSVRPNLRVQVGLRHDRYSTFEGTTNPRLALIFSPRENTTFKVLYGQAFRAPNAYEQFYYRANRLNLAPRLAPEKIRTTEIVWEQYFRKNYRFAATAYYNQLSDLINQERNLEDGGLRFVNLEDARGKGLEFEIERKSASGWQSRVSYAIQKSVDAWTGDVLSNSPQQLVKANMNAPLWRRFLHVGLEGQYTSARRSAYGAEVPGSFVTNLTFFGPKLARGLTWSASIDNLFDTRYGDPGANEHLQRSLQQDGRIFRFKLSYNVGSHK